jgi:hypothetical protein
MSEAWPRMLSTAQVLGCFTRLEGEVLNWLPVDVAAKGCVEIAFTEGYPPPTTTIKGSLQEESDGREMSETCTVFHLLAPTTAETPMWNDLLSWLQEATSSYGKATFHIVPLETWLQKLRALDSHPAQALIGLWERNLER